MIAPLGVQHPRAPKLHLAALLLALLVAVCPGAARAQQRQALRDKPLPALPRAIDGAFIGAQQGTILVAGGIVRDHTGAAVPTADVLALRPGAAAWEKIGQLPKPRAFGAVASTPRGLLMAGGGDSVEAALLQCIDGQLLHRPLPNLPHPITQPAAAVLGSVVYLAGGEGSSFLTLDLSHQSPAWQPWQPPPIDALSSPSMIALQEAVYLFGAHAAKPVTWRFDSRTGWTARAPPPSWPEAGADAAVPYGHAHIFLFGAARAGEVPTYHTITDTWLTFGLPPAASGADITMAAPLGGQSLILIGDRATALEPEPITTNYGWWDHAVVAIYLIAMVAMGWYFAGREKNTRDYFRGGQRVPWWATGMSLFATGASAISLMAMPGKAFATDWTYFSISVFSVMALPVSIFFLAPLVRRLNIATANEYLERRFGVAARLFASAVYCFTQVCGRMAPVMLLPSIALSAITGIDIIVSILIMGLITTVYTYLGGLEAVIWTDTVQGFIMCAAVLGCLILAIAKLSVSPAALWSTAAAFDKTQVFDWSLSLVYPVAWVFLISTVILTLAGIGDQNFIQRVQCTPTLRDAKKAIGMQLAVAVPINVLLFSLGTALWLFYRGRPEQLNPAMQTDGVFPFFVAQQLPPGVSGLVVAALLAATMSTISSSICSVADLGVNDFYRRFRSSASDRSSFLLGKALMGVVGISGTAVAILLGRLGAASVWDLALLVTGLISNGIIGLFWVGLLTRRAHELGALLGVACGMGTVILLQQLTPVHFLWYQTAGAMVTFITGYLFSLVLPGRIGDLSGLTIFTLPPRACAADGAPAAATA